MCYALVRTTFRGGNAPSTTLTEVNNEQELEERLASLKGMQTIERVSVFKWISTHSRSEAWVEATPDATVDNVSNVTTKDTTHEG